MGQLSGKFALSLLVFTSVAFGSDLAASRPKPTERFNAIRSEFQTARVPGKTDLRAGSCWACLSANGLLGRDDATPSYLRFQVDNAGGLIHDIGGCRGWRSVHLTAYRTLTELRASDLPHPGVSFQNSIRVNAVGELLVEYSANGTTTHDDYLMPALAGPPPEFPDIVFHVLQYSRCTSD